MGCTQSKIENEETVNRCRERKQFMERAVTARNKFAAAHSAHAMSLKNTGAALSDFAEGEDTFPASSSAVVVGGGGGATLPPPLRAYDNFIPPPPPLPPTFTNSTSLKRASTMPEFSIPQPENQHVDTDTIMEEENEEDDEEIETNSHSLKRHSRSSKSNRGRSEITPPSGASWDYFFSMENHEMEEAKDEMLGERGKERDMDGMSEKEDDVAEGFSELPPQPPPPEVALVAAKVVKRGKQPVPAEGKRGSKLNLLQIFVQLDDSFLKASESAHEVSRMLEATRLHYHSNFADKKGNINHSERVMRVITWNRSFRGLPIADDGIDDFDSEEHETHATVLDKMLAWEKKLYDEVKTGEQMKLEYQKKVAKLNKLKRRGSNTEKLERMKASVSHLHTRYIVDMQSMDSTVSEINGLRDQQLYPKLVALIDGMATMWETIRIHHVSQSKIVQALRSLDISQSSKETSDQHHERTRQLGGVVQEWHTNFGELMSQQKEYIKSLNSWLKLNLVPIDTNWKEKVTSPSRPENPPIQILLHAWQEHLDKIPDEPAKATINNFAAIMKSIWEYQKEELESRNRCEDSRKELIRKTREFENWYNKYMQKRTPPDEMDEERAEDKDLVTERQLVVEAAKQKLEEDEDSYHRQCIQVREKTLMSLKSHIPELFRALSVFSLACSDMYANLRSLSRSLNNNGVR